jgi:hypothetical protein
MYILKDPLNIHTFPDGLETIEVPSIVDLLQTNCGPIDKAGPFPADLASADTLK